MLLGFICDCGLVLEAFASFENHALRLFNYFDLLTRHFMQVFVLLRQLTVLSLQ